MAESRLKLLLPLILCALLFLFEEWASTPSCKVVPAAIPNAEAEYSGAVADESANDLKVMIVADLLLLGSDSTLVNLYFRDYYLSKFFKKSFHSLKPDMLLVMGDVSAKGSELTKKKWVSVFHQFHRIIGPFLALPFHIVLGDRDIGHCDRIDTKSVQWISRHFPGLDSAGCGSFEINNVSFVSLNSVALLCGNNELRFNIEKVIEKESSDLQLETLYALEATHDFGKSGEAPDDLGWRKNAMLSGSGPVLLLHIPLHQMLSRNIEEGKSFRNTVSPFQSCSSTLISRGFVRPGPYELLKMLPPNATEYIFQALKPSIIFSAHQHEFGDHTHPDGTREIIVPSMAWSARDDPGFVVTTFKGANAVSVSYCSLARESHVILVYAFFALMLVTTLLLTRTTEFTPQR